MHIGIDARTIFQGGGGDRTYFRNIIEAMAALSPDDRWTLYADNDNPDRNSLQSANVTLAPASPAPIGALWNVTSLLPRLRRDKGDVLHSQYTLPPFGSVPCPMIVTIHDATFRLFPHWFPRRANRLQNILIPIAARRAARILTGSQSAADDIARTMDVDREKIVVTPYGVDSRFRPVSESEQEEARTRYGLPQIYLLGVGLMGRRKNVATIFQAIAQLQAQDQWPEGTALALTGQGAVALSVPTFVRMLGFVPDGDLPALYSAATGSVYPSLYEGFGLPALEAMACGCPVAASNTSSLPEVVGDAGLLLPPDEVSAWAAALLTLLHDNDERARLRLQGLNQAAQFTWEQTARRTLAVYREVTGR